MNRRKYSHIEFTFTDKNGLKAKCLEPINTLSVIQMGNGEVIVYVPDEGNTIAEFQPLEPYKYFREILTGECVPQSPLDQMANSIQTEFLNHQFGPQEYVDEDPEAYPVEELPGKDPEPRG